MQKRRNLATGHDLGVQIRATTTDDDLADVVRMRLDFIADIRGIAPETLDPAFVTATERFVRDRAAADRLHSWIAEHAGERVGLVSVLVADAPPLPEELRVREGYVVNMFVVPSARRRGIARAMLDAVIETAPVLGLRRLYLHSTDAGRPLYGEAGFTTDTRWMARRLPIGSPSKA